MLFVTSLMVISRLLGTKIIKIKKKSPTKHLTRSASLADINDISYGNLLYSVIQNGLNDHFLLYQEWKWPTCAMTLNLYLSRILNKWNWNKITGNSASVNPIFIQAWKISSDTEWISSHHVLLFCYPETYTVFLFFLMEQMVKPGSWIL